jgi:hypothetical protein
VADEPLPAISHEELPIMPACNTALADPTRKSKLMIIKIPAFTLINIASSERFSAKVYKHLYFF